MRILKKAGLNPILSANGGANAYSAPQEQVIGFDLVGQRQASSSAKQADTAAEQMKSNITLQDELGWKAKQDALNAASSAAFTNYQNQLLHDYGAKVKMKELDRLDAEIEAIKSNAVSSARQASAAEMSQPGLIVWQPLMLQMLSGSVPVVRSVVSTVHGALSLAWKNILILNLKMLILVMLWNMVTKIK